MRGEGEFDTESQKFDCRRLCVYMYVCVCVCVYVCVNVGELHAREPGSNLRFLCFTRYEGGSRLGDSLVRSRASCRTLSF